MKKMTLNICRAALLAAAVTTGAALAQDSEKPEVVVPLKDTAAVKVTASGNITEVTDDAIYIKGAGDAHPMGYVTTKATYVDDDGAPAQRASAKKGHAVTITYVVQGEIRVALQVNIRNAP